MTGFATSELVAGKYRLVWELRSVNHRYLDLGFRLPDELKKMEPRFRELLTTVICRGKVECTLQLVKDDGTAADFFVDSRVVGSLAAAEARIRELVPDATPLSVADIVRWPGVLTEPQTQLTEIEQPALASLAEAIERLQASRLSEGSRICAYIEQRCAAIIDAIDDVTPIAGLAADRYREKLTQRLARLDVLAQPDRLEQEMVLIAQRMDVTEEVDRLASHVAEIRSVLKRDEPIGRRLDFLMQELNREANTLGSKAQDDELTRISVEVKVLIEQMREQVQNVE